MQTKQQTTSIGFLGVLTLIFITLKLTGYITWSWWWVLSPLWLPLAVLLTTAAFIAIVAHTVGKK